MAGRAIIWLVCLSLAAVVFAIDLFVPLGVAVGVFYVFIVLLTVSLKQRWDTSLMAILCSALMILGAFLSPRQLPPELEFHYALFNVSDSLVAIWATAFVIERLRSSRAQLAALNKELEQRVEERAADSRHRAAELTQANVRLEKEVAQREKAEREARNSQAVYASLVEDLPIPIIRKDDRGRFVFANRAFCSWVGYKREQIIGHTDFDFAPRALAEKYRRDDQSVIDTGELFLDVEKNEHGGKVNWVHVIKTPARDGEGNIVGMQAIFWDVTAKREAEDRVRESEALYHSLVDTLPLCLLRKDSSGAYTFLNKRWCEYFDIEPKALLGKNDFDIFPEELARRYREGDMAVLTTGETYEDVEKIELLDGRQRHIDVIKSPVRDADDNIAGVQIIFRDVTEELEMEAALKKSEQQLQAVLDNASAVIYIKDTHGKYLLINREFEELFATKLADTVGKTDQDLFPPEFAAAFQRVDRRVVESGQTIETEEVAPQPDGPHTYITSKFPLRNENGEVYAVAGISTDITRQKRIEAALRDSEERARRIVGTANDAFISIDAAGVITDWNTQAERTFGWSRGEAVGKPLTETIIPPEFHQAHVGGMKRFLATGKASILNQRIEVVGRHKDGRQSPVELTVWPLRSGDTFQFNAFVHDITQRKQAEEQLKRYAARLEATNRELEEFAYVVSHDLQEPLRTLQFFSDSLQADLGESLDEQPRRDLQFIAQAAERMQMLVRDLLSLSRTGRTEMKRDAVPLNDCVADALTALSNRIRERGAQVEADDLPQVDGDRTLLTQLFQNLIGNALKFVPHGKTPQVSITGGARDGVCEVCVADNGIGIKSDYAQKIFAPFQRLHASSEYEGTGIGLAICRKVVQRHGGKIWVESQPGAGAKFCFELPLAGSAAPSRLTATSR